MNFNTHLFKSIVVLLFPFSIYSQSVEVNYNSQSILNMDNQLNEQSYLVKDGNLFQQSFRISADDVNISTAKIKYLFLNSLLGLSGGINFNFYEGDIGNLGTAIYSQTYSEEYIEVEAGFVHPEETTTAWGTRLIRISGDLELEAGKQYVLEIVVPEGFPNLGFGFKTTNYNFGRSNRGDSDIWMKFYGEVQSKADTTLELTSTENSSYQLDNYSNFFPTQLLNKYEPLELLVNSAFAGDLEYLSSDPSMVDVSLVTQSRGSSDQISLTGYKTGKALIYMVYQTDTISYLNVRVTDKKMIQLSYQYIKYPGEGEHDFLTAFGNITNRISELYSPSNVYIEYLDQGIIEYDWDLNQDGDSYTASRIEIDSTTTQIPNADSYLSNLFLVRLNKTDDYFGGSNGDGSSIGYGTGDSPPRFAYVNLHLFRTQYSLAETLAHELGHNLGLNHYSSSNNLRPEIPFELENLMKTGRTDNLIYSFQSDVIHNTINTFEDRGENYDTRPIAQINNFEDRVIFLEENAFSLLASTDSDAKISFKLMNGSEFISLDKEGTINLLAQGTAEIAAFVYGTNQHQAATKTISITVKKACVNSASQLDITACDSYTSPSGKYVFTANAVFADTVPNAIGCDSILQINLNIETLSDSVIQDGSNLTATQDGATYQWLDCNNSMTPIMGETNPNYENVPNGDYAVEISRNGCIVVSACFNITSVAIVEPRLSSLLNIYPNPTNQSTRVQLDKVYNNIRTSLLNGNGQIISDQTFYKADEFTLDIPERVGLYFIKIELNGQAPTLVKIVKK